MFSKNVTDKKNIFVNTIKVNKKESKTTPSVNVKVSQYDRIVKIVTNNDDNEIKHELEEFYEPKKKYILLFR